MVKNVIPINKQMILDYLSSLSEKTEDVFLNLAKNLPALFREIEQGMNEADQLLKVFSKEITVCTDGDLHSSISDSIESAETLLEDTSHFFSSLEARDTELFKTVSGSIEALSILEHQLENIKEDSIEIEVVSLNAKIAALKAGKNSAGFVYISNEHQKLSRATTNYSEKLTNLGDSVLKKLTSFTHKIENIQNMQQSFYKKFRDNLTEFFKNYNLEVDELVKHLDSALTDAENVKMPLSRIMEIVQLQDIIRQSLQHVELVFTESDITIQTEDSEQTLDELIFTEILHQLCSDLLGDIKKTITSSIDSFNSNIEELRAILKDVNRGSSRHLNISDSTPSEDSGHAVLSDSVSNSTDILDDLFISLIKSMDTKSRISDDAEIILNTLNQLEKGFSASLEIVSQFYPININARVEVARWDILNKIGVTTDEMSDATDKINSDVLTAMDQLKKMKEEIENSINLYTDRNDDELDNISAIIERIRECYGALNRSGKVLADTIHTFSVFSNSFFSLLDTAEKDILGLTELTEVIDDIRENLEGSVRSIQIRKEQILHELGLENWSLRNSRLEKIISKFTIYSHKQTAENISGTKLADDSEAGEAGELTLF